MPQVARADLCLNVICSEQDLAQQKVALAMYMMNPAMAGRQYHVSYDLVKLTSGRMSGARPRARAPARRPVAAAGAADRLCSM